MEGLDDVEVWIHTCWGNPMMQKVYSGESYANSIDTYLNRLKGDVWTVEMTERDFAEIDLFKPYAGNLAKKVAVGVVNHRQLQADLPSVVAGRVRRALEVIPADKLVLSSDCGFGRQGCNRTVAYYKAAAIAQGRNIVLKELGVEERYVPGRTRRSRPTCCPTASRSPTCRRPGTDGPMDHDDAVRMLETIAAAFDATTSMGSWPFADDAMLTDRADPRHGARDSPAGRRSARGSRPASPGSRRALPGGFALRRRRSRGVGMDAVRDDDGRRSDRGPRLRPVDLPRRHGCEEGLVLEDPDGRVARDMTDAMRVILEVGKKRRVVAGAMDWPGLDRWGAGEEAAIERLSTYRPGTRASPSGPAWLASSRAAGTSRSSSAYPDRARPTSGASPTCPR